MLQMTHSEICLDAQELAMIKHDIPVYAPWISTEDAEEVKRVALSGWVSSTGPEILRFEEEFAASTGSRKGISCSSGTAALHLSLRAAGIGPGDEVIVPDLTFVATASMVVASGATPVFADVSPHDWNLAAESVARCVTPRTRAVMAVHLYGNPADCASLAKAAPKAMIIEDAAQSCGASRDNVKAGAFGRFGCFSFFGNKIITTGEGGMVVTDDPELASRMHFLRGHAMSPDRRYFHPELGFNYRMTGMQAAIGRSQLRRLDEILARKKKNAKLYAERLADLPELCLHPSGTETAQSIFWMYSILTPSQTVRDTVMNVLHTKGIDTRPFFHPMSSLPPFAGHRADAPVSRKLSETGLNLPSGPLLTEEEVDFVAEAVREALGRSKRLKVTSITTFTRTHDVTPVASRRERRSLPIRKKRAELPLQI
jgi:perosamine synthetase